MSFVYFLGRLHVVMLHLPIGIVLVTLLVEWLSKRERFRSFEAVTPVLWIAGAVTAVVTAALGLLHAQEGIEGESVASHRAFGLAFAALVVVVCVLRIHRAGLYRRAQLPLAVGLLVLVTLTGHYGGNITHGSAYLFEYAPGPVRTLAGIEAPRHAVTDLAQAEVYRDVVQPIFSHRCGTCHNDDRKKGGLSLSSLKRLLAGGRNGPVIIPGDTVASDLYRRISLPADHKDFMPAEGKPPLTDAEKHVIEWWIAAGSPTDTRVANVQLTDDVRAAMLEVLGLGGTRAASRDTPAVPSDLHAGDGDLHARPADMSPAPAASLEKLASLGFVIRPVAVDSPWLEVSFTKGQNIAPEALEALVAVKAHVVELNLREAGVRDADLALIAQLTNLERLRLERNDISDAGVRHLAALRALRSLNLYGTKITNASLATLAKLESLRQLYVFDTAVTEPFHPRLAGTSQPR
jgi:uncharacterized membrane protein